MGPIEKNIDGLYPDQPYSNSNTQKPFGSTSGNFAKNVSDLAAESFYNKKVQPDAASVPKLFSSKSSGLPRSIFNNYALFNFRGFYGGLLGDRSMNFRDKGGPNPLSGGTYAHKASVSKIVEYFSQYYPKIAYKPQDFLYSKYYKKIPVNHLLTLRRFPIPTTDNIYSHSVRPNGAETGSVDATQVAGVTAITYMGEKTGNPMEEILQFTYGLNWKEVKSEMESISSGDGGYTSQPFYNKIGPVGAAVRATANTLKGVSAGNAFARKFGSGSTTDDRLSSTYPNFVLGPVNVVDSTIIRDRGLKFMNDMSLNFEYELKSLNYINPKIAMIDLISNMLTMTTNNAQFFGGGHRYYGSAGYVASQFGDPNKLRRGDFAGYVGSVVSELDNGFKGLFGSGDGGFNIENILNGFKSVGKNLIGNVLGSFLGGQVGAISGTQATKAFISAEPTAEWHLTVGNPLNPIAMMGNMYCDNVVMTMGQGLGYDDFPMSVKFTVDLKHGKPRDKGDIENMFNAGNGRIYAAAANTDDILNLRGIEVDRYGTIPDVGTSSIQKGQSDKISANDLKATNINNKERSGKNWAKGVGNDSAEYTSNVIRMMIEG